MGLNGAMAGMAIRPAAATSSRAQPSSQSARRLSVVSPQAVATPSKPPSMKMPKRSAVEIFKQESDFLRHPLMQVCFRL